jgi:hypothetical protein
MKLTLVQPKRRYEAELCKDIYDEDILTEVIQRLSYLTNLDTLVVIRTLQQIFPRWEGLRDPSFILNYDNKTFWRIIPERIKRMVKYPN